MSAIFLKSSLPLQYAAIRSDGRVYNFSGTQGWDVLPSTGIPAAANLQPMMSPYGAGPLKYQQVAVIPDIVSGSGSVALVTFTADAAGNLTQVDCLNFASIEMPLKGGVGR